MRKKIAALLAMLMLGGVLTGCGGGNKVATGGEDPNVVPEDTYEINWYMQGMPQEDVASVEAAVNDYLKDKINATLKMHRLESNQYSKQLNTMIAAGEYFDIAWTTPGVLTYTANARNGAWLALDDYIDTYIPKTIEQLGEIADNARVDGKLYAIPTYKEMADSRGWTYRKDIAEKYIIPGETAESALMFLPSEAIYAELHANFRDVVEVSYRSKVWIVSPTTLMATLNTVRAILKDARMREMAGVIQKEVGVLVEDIGRLDDRIENLSKHFEMASRDIGEIKVSSGKISRRIEKIEDLQLGEAEKPLSLKHAAVNEN